MKKMKIILLILFSTSFLFVGCGNYMVELTAEDSTVIAEYAAGLLLKYDKNHKSKMLSDVQIEKEQEKQRILEAEAAKRAEEKAEKEEKKEEKEQDTNNSSSSELTEQPIRNVDLASFLGLEGFSIDYQSYEIVKSYPTTQSDEMFLSMDATAGNDLVVLHFNISNSSETSEPCDIFSKQIRCGIIVNGGNKKNVLVTMLPNDFSEFQSPISADPVDAVLVAEMKSEEIQHIENIILTLKYNDETIRMSLE